MPAPEPFRLKEEFGADLPFNAFKPEFLDPLHDIQKRTGEICLADLRDDVPAARGAGHAAPEEPMELDAQEATLQLTQKGPVRSAPSSNEHGPPAGVEEAMFLWNGASRGGGGRMCREARHEGFAHHPPFFSEAGFLRHFKHGVFATWLYMVTQIPTKMAKFLPR